MVVIPAAAEEGKERKNK